MQRFLRWLKRLTAFRIGLAVGLFCAALHVVQIAGRWDVPLLTRLESALVDLRFQQRAYLSPAKHSGRVVIAAIDEPAIARYGRWPWDRRVLAGLVDKLNAAGAQAIGFDMSFSDEDLGGAIASAKRYRKRFEDVSLAAPQNRVAVDRFAAAEGDIAGAASALEELERQHHLKPGAGPIYQTAKGRLADGKQKLTDARDLFDALVHQHEAYAAELEHDLGGDDPDTALGAAIARAGDKVVLGWVALTGPEMRDFKPGEIEEHVARIERTQLHAPEQRTQLQGGGELAKPVPLAWLKEYPGLRAPLPPIARGTKWFGFFNALPDGDGVIRHTALAMRLRGRTLPSLETALAGIALGLTPSQITPVTLSDEPGAPIDHVDFGGKRQVPTDERGLLAINYAGQDRTFANYSIADILAGKLEHELQGKIVLIGATAQGTFDQRVTPLNKISAGIELHANAIENILSGTWLVRGTLVETLEVFFLLALGVGFAFAFARVRVQLALPVLALSAIVIWVAASIAFAAGFPVATALPLVEMLSMFVLVTVFRYATEERDKRQLRKAFQLYLNPEVMEELLEDPDTLQLGGKEMELTVLFSDIRGFTSISETLSPQALVHLLNEYLSPMTDIVFRKRGTLDKYIGDAVMAFFGAPVQTDKHAANACDAALDMIAGLARLREKWRIEDPRIPQIDVGIGINTGPMVVGNMGSSQRFNYTVMGDNVNLASRLEGLNKEYGTHILVSEATLQAARRGLGDESAYSARELDSVRVKGRKEPVRLFELRSRAPAKAHELGLLQGYAEGLALYRAQRFAEARVHFESLLLRYPEDGPSKLMLSRCDGLRHAPPDQSWDGVFRMAHK